MSNDPIDDLASLDSLPLRDVADWKKRVRIFAIVNFVLAAAMGVANMVQVLSVGSAMSGLMGSASSALPDVWPIVASLIGLGAIAVYVSAGVCLWREHRWGYVLNIVGCVITTALCVPAPCIFIPWTVFGLTWGTHAGFKRVLTANEDEPYDEDFVD